MTNNRLYDVAITGGGLAGLSSAILLARSGFSVALLEKEQYPFHKVCGEYISNESRNFLGELGLPLQTLCLPDINTLELTAPSGKAFTTRLDLGGFGLSRYAMDNLLFEIAQREGVDVFQNTKVTDIEDGEIAQITAFSKKDGALHLSARVSCGAFGKKSNLDTKWKRDFLVEKDRRLNNFIGVKYHIESDWEANLIGLHNFADGYCGISKIEDGRYCLCYLTTAENLRKNGNDINEMERHVLARNPRLKEILDNRIVCDSFPVTISQIGFQSKTQVEHASLMLGDAAGMITPLCGNGMSIALHTGKLAALRINEYLEGHIDRSQMHAAYASDWQRHFSARLSRGRLLQKFFGKESTSNFFVAAFRAFPFLATPVVKLTHGKPY